MKSMSPLSAVVLSVVLLLVAYGEADRLPVGAEVGRQTQLVEPVFVLLRDGQPHARPFDLLTGFLGPEGEADGRPVGVAVDRRGDVLVADNLDNTVWRVTPQ